MDRKEGKKKNFFQGCLVAFSLLGHNIKRGLERRRKKGGFEVKMLQFGITSTSFLLTF